MKFQPILKFIFIIISLTESRTFFSYHNPQKSIPPYLIFPGESEPTNSHNHPLLYHHGKPECAQLWNIYGMEIHVGLNQGLQDLDMYNFIPVQLRLRDRTVLITVDVQGQVQVIWRSLKTGEQVKKGYMTTLSTQGTMTTVKWSLRPYDLVVMYPGNPIVYTHCESCLGKVPQLLNESSNPACAILYESPYCSTMLGFAIEVSHGDEEATLLPRISRKISSVVVRDGCTLEIYEGEGFTGRGAIVEGTVDLLSPEWCKKIASFKCTCRNLPNRTSTTENPWLSSSTIQSSTTVEVTSTSAEMPTSTPTSPWSTSTSTTENEATPSSSTTTESIATTATENLPPSSTISTSSTTEVVTSSLSTTEPPIFPSSTSPKPTTSTQPDFPVY